MFDYYNYILYTKLTNIGLSRILTTSNLSYFKFNKVKDLKKCNRVQTFKNVIDVKKFNRRLEKCNHMKSVDDKFFDKIRCKKEWHKFGHSYRHQNSYGTT